MNSTPPTETAPSGAHITVRLDGTPIELPSGASLAALLLALPQTPESVATALNGQFVPRDRRAATALSDGDQVLLFQPIVGG